jgi:subtilisin
MRRVLVLVGLPAVLLAVALTPASADRAERSYIVVLHADVARPAAVAADHARRYGAEVSHVYRSALKGYAATIPSRRVGDVRADDRVDFLSTDGTVRAAQQTLPTGIDRIEGDVSSTVSGDGIGSVSTPVAILDTGSGPHPDLNVVGGVNCSRGRSFGDGNGHGTHVAGTAAAKDDGVGVVGVAPGAPLYSVRVLNNAGFGSFGDVICGIDWVTSNAASLGIEVANMSLGGGGSDDGNCGLTNNDAMHLAICNSVDAGVAYVVAAGNSNTDFAGSVPAAYNEVLTVSAMADFNGQPGGGAAPTCRTDVDDTAADFSNFTILGSSDVDHTIAGPGVCILSTWKGGRYETISGTSMATPHVAGTVALCVASGGCAGQDPAQIISRLRSDSSTRPASYGFGGDLNNPITRKKGPHGTETLYYGYLVYAGGY